VPIGGAFAALPALEESGLAAVDQLFPMTVERPMQGGCYGIDSAGLSLPEPHPLKTLQLLAPPSWKRILCSKRLPDDRTVTELIWLICSAPQTSRGGKQIGAGGFLAKMSGLDALLSVNDCRQMYVNGERVGLKSSECKKDAPCALQGRAMGPLTRGQTLLLASVALCRTRSVLG